jgi:membrane protein
MPRRARSGQGRWAGAEVEAGVEHVRELRVELDQAVVDDLVGLEVEGTRSLDRHPGAARLAAVADLVRRRQGSQPFALVASGAAFWLLISASPIAIAVVSVYGLVVEPSRVASDLGHLADAAPGSLGSLVGDQLQHVAATDAAGLSIGLAVSIVLAVWSASAGIYHLDGAVREVYGLPRQRYVDARVRSFAAAAVLVVALGAIALAAGAALAHTRGVLAYATGIPLAFVGIALAIAAMYRFAVGRPMTAGAVLPGAMAAAAGMMVLLVGFSAYASASTHFTAVYGAFSAAVVGMLATYLAVGAVLLGAGLNVALNAGSFPPRPTGAAPSD